MLSDVLVLVSAVGIFFCFFSFIYFAMVGAYEQATLFAMLMIIMAALVAIFSSLRVMLFLDGVERGIKHAMRWAWRKLKSARLRSPVTFDRGEDQ